MMRPERTRLGKGLEISRIVTGLWQVADMERSGRTLDPEAAADALEAYVRDGFDTFDMADHYGSAELIAGRLLARGTKAVALTKWCPKPGPMTREVVRAGIEERCRRLGVERIDLLQLHWWSFEHPAYLDAFAELKALQDEGVIGELGVTNFDTDHLRVVVGQGIRLASNQVSLSLLDRRATQAMSAFCRQHGIRLLAYGTLAGGFLADAWLGRPEPERIGDWSKMKYRRFIDAIGGWGVLQAILAAAHEVAQKHGVSISNVATRWVLDQPEVAAVIVGARPGEREHRADNLRTFGFTLDEADLDRLDRALGLARPIPGDCGDEYRRPPYLTASGDLSDHLDALPKVYHARAHPRLADRQIVDSGSVWEGLAGYSRAVRVGDQIHVSGTTATHGHGTVVCKDDPAGQAVYILDKIAASLAALGGGLEHVVRTRILLADIRHWEPVARVHGRVFGEIRPANTLVEAKLVGEYLVEIEALAILG